MSRTDGAAARDEEGRSKARGVPCQRGGRLAREPVGRIRDAYVSHGRVVRDGGDPL